MAIYSNMQLDEFLLVITEG